MTQPLITVIGSLNADLITRTSRIPSAGETLTSQSFDTGFGGKGANQATACARLSRRYDTVERGELRVKMVGMIGDDAFGQDIKWPMVSNGIDITDVWLQEGQKTGVAVIIVEEETGENRILLSPNANYCMKPAQFATIPGRVPDLIVLQLEIPLETVLRILEVAYERKIFVIFNPAPAQPLSKEAYKAIRHLIVNESEAAILSEAVTLSETSGSDRSRFSDLPPLPDTPIPSTPSSFSSKAPTLRNSSISGFSDIGRLSDASGGLATTAPLNTARSHVSQPSSSSISSGRASVISDATIDSTSFLSNFTSMAQVFRRLGVKIIIITLGSRGIFLSISGQNFHFPAEPVDVVDTTAAGDTFVGAYAVAIAKYRSRNHTTNQILSAAKWANKCAAKTVEKKGAQSAIPWLNEVAPFRLEEFEWDEIACRQGVVVTPSVSAT